MSDMTISTKSREVYRILKPFLKSNKRWPALGLVAILTGLMFAGSSVAVFSGKIGGKVQDAMLAQDVHQWLIVMGLCVTVPLILMAINSAYQYLRTKLALDMREWITNDLFDKWFLDGVSDRMRHDPRVDNPEQRMTEGVDSFANSVVGLLMDFMDAIVKFLMFIFVLFFIAVMLGGAAIAWAIFGTVVCMFIGKPLIELNNLRAKSEADLRMILAEAQSSGVEEHRGDNARAALARVILTLRKIMTVNRNLNFFTIPFQQLTPLMPVLVIAPLWFHSGMTIGVVVTATVAFGNVVNSGTLIVQQIGGITSFFATVERLATMVDVLDEYVADREKHLGEKHPVDAAIKALLPGQTGPTKLTTTIVRTVEPELVKRVVTEVRHGLSWMLIGGSVRKKTAAFDAVTEEERCTEGSSGTNENLVVLMRSPVLPIGTIRQVLTVNSTVPDASDAQLRAVLKLAGLHTLEHHHGGLDRVTDWSAKLTLADQQRLAMARVFLTKPKYVFLNGATSALDASVERGFYLQLKAMGIAVVTLGHRLSLLEYHDMVAEFPEHGGCRVFPTREYKRAV